LLRLEEGFGHYVSVNLHNKIIKFF